MTVPIVTTLIIAVISLIAGYKINKSASGHQYPVLINYLTGFGITFISFILIAAVFWISYCVSDLLGLISYI